MSTETVTCHIIVCNMCKERFDTETTGLGYTRHYSDPEHAAEDAREGGWIVTENGVYAACNTDDAMHNAARVHFDHLYEAECVNREAESKRKHWEASVLPIALSPYEQCGGCHACVVAGGPLT